MADTYRRTATHVAFSRKAVQQSVWDKLGIQLSRALVESAISDFHLKPMQSYSWRRLDFGFPFPIVSCGLTSPERSSALDYPFGLPCMFLILATLEPWSMLNNNIVMLCDICNIMALSIFHSVFIVYLGFKGLKSLYAMCIIVWLTVLYVLFYSHVRIFVKVSTFVQINDNDDDDDDDDDDITDKPGTTISMRICVHATHTNTINHKNNVFNMLS